MALKKDIGGINVPGEPVVTPSRAPLVEQLVKGAIGLKKGYESNRLTGKEDSTIFDSTFLSPSGETQTTLKEHLTLRGIAAARRQGKITAAQAKALAGAAVKEASDRLPSMASEFRKQAATFFSDFAEGQDLLDTTGSGKGGVSQAEKDLAQIHRMTIEKYGFYSEENRQKLVFHLKNKAFLDTLETERKVDDITVQERGKLSNQAEAEYQKQTYGTFIEFMDQASKLAEQGDDVALGKIRAQAIASIEKAENGVVQRAQEALANKWISPDEYDKYVERHTAPYEGMKEALKDIDSLKVTSRVLNSLNTRRLTFEEKINLARPAIILGKMLGIANKDNMSLFFQNPEGYKDRYPSLYKLMNSIYGDNSILEMSSTAINAVLEGKADFKDFSLVNPDLGAGLRDLFEATITDLQKGGGILSIDKDNPRQRQVFVEGSAALFRSVNPAVPESIDKAIKLLELPGYIDSLNKLNPGEKERIFGTLKNKTGEGLITYFNKLNKSLGNAKDFKVEITNRGKLKVIFDTYEARVSSDLPTSKRGRNKGKVSTIFERKEVQAFVKRINRMGDTIEKLQMVAPNIFNFDRKETINALVNKYIPGYTTTLPSTNNTPKSTPTQISSISPEENKQIDKQIEEITKGIRNLDLDAMILYQKTNGIEGEALANLFRDERLKDVSPNKIIDLWNKAQEVSTSQ